ncbi:MAG: T9SS type A sorting domain-containing protein [Flavobacteriales bacterium]|nr:T9SS type A sorting domain-containing protein [Flavobacteriales bacterium]
MRASLIPLALLPLLACAQSWCPPGATWTFNYADMFNGSHGITRVVYEGDTAVGGYTAQKLRETNVIAPFGTMNYTSYTVPGSLLTREADGVVYVWSGWPEAFDTLMWFSADPGQFWSGPGMDDDPFNRITVLDTSTVLIAGVPLRQLIVQQSDWVWMPPDTLRERIGFSFLYLNGWSWFLTDMPWGGLRCYTDDNLTFIGPNVTDCGFTLSMNESTVGSTLELFPNPGTTHVTLDLAPGPHTITLFDATGRMVLQQRTTDERPVIGTEQLPAGLYRITVRDEQGAIMGAMWVKER